MERIQLVSFQGSIFHVKALIDASKILGFFLGWERHTDNIAPLQQKHIAELPLAG